MRAIPSLCRTAGITASCLLVALLWGGTNPFLRAGADAAARASPPKTGRWLPDAAAAVARTLANWRFLLPFAINQLGSVAFNLTLGAAPLVIAGPVSNSLTVVVTWVVARLALGESEPVTLARVCGAVLVLVGVATCIHSQLD